MDDVERELREPERELREREELRRVLPDPLLRVVLRVELERLWGLYPERAPS